MTDEQGDDQTMRYFDLAEFIPAAWHYQQLRVSTYRAYRLPKADLGATQPFDLVGVRGQLFWGGAPYLELTEWIEPLRGGGLLVHTEVGQMRHTPVGAYLMLTTPTEPGTPDEEARSRLQSALALLRLALGPNVAVLLLSEFIYTVSTSTVTVLQTIRPPELYPPPDSSKAGLLLVADLDEALRSQTEQDRNRIELSLQWFCRASETFGIDGFLMYWFALETLAMPGGRLIALKNQLAKIYPSHATAQPWSRVKSLYGVRGNIVHNGRLTPLDRRVLDYLGALYWDLLLDTLRLDPRYAAAEILAKPDIDDWFPKPDKRVR